MVVAGIVFIFNFELFWNIIVYGNIAGPCVWPSDYEARGGDLSILEYDEEEQCYLKP